MSVVVVVIVVALAAGFVARGSLRSFEQLHVRAWGLALAGLAIQMIPAPRGFLNTLLLITSYSALLVFVVANRHLAGSVLMFAGLILNLTVIAANGGMPVAATALRIAGGNPHVIDDGKHHLMGANEMLMALGDVIPLPPFGVVISVGDLALYGGIVWLVLAIMLGPAREVTLLQVPAPEQYRGKHAPPVIRRTPVGHTYGFEGPPAVARSGSAR